MRYRIILILLCLIAIGSAAPTTPSTPTGPISGASGTSYNYMSSAQEQVRYTFDWGDGTSTVTGWMNAGLPADASHAYTVAAGTNKTFQVTTTVNDSKSVATSAPLPVIIAGPSITTNHPPKTAYTPSGPLSGRTTYSYSYSTKATDPDGDQVKYTFDWGDGTTSTTSLVNSGTLASATHQWSPVEPGTFKGFAIRAMTTDNKSATSSGWSNPINVSMGTPYVNHAPSIPVMSGPNNCVSGVSYNFTIVATDPDAGNIIKYMIGWTDGTTTTTGYFPSGQIVPVSHTWNIPVGATWVCNVAARASDQASLSSAFMPAKNIIVKG